MITVLTLQNLSIAAIGFFGMEAVTYVVHRFVMHGGLVRLHRSHHRNAAAPFADKTPEPNDIFPLAFSVVVIVGVWLGFNVRGLAWLLPLLVGVSVYGMIYTLIHDGIVHGRIRWMKRLHTSWSDSLTSAHRQHHLSNGEPYGMLFPSLTLRNSPSRNGSLPSQVPLDQ